MTKDNKKSDNKYTNEEKWASILLRYLNSKGCDYKITKLSIPQGWADVDVCAKSPSDKYPPLYIQLCLDVEPGNEGYEKIMENPKVYTFNNCSDAEGAIERKIEKYIKQKKDFSKIILAVQSIGSYFIEDDEKYIIEPLKEKIKKLKKKYKNIGSFKAIYLLSKEGEICDGQMTQKDPERVFQIF